MKTLDEYFRDWEADVFGYGYGTGEFYTLSALKMFMEKVIEKGFYDYSDLEKTLGGHVTWLTINILCSADVITYGVSPRFGSLSDTGTQLKLYLSCRSVDDLYNICCNYDNDYINCTRKWCNCEDGSVKGDIWRGCVVENPFWRPDKWQIEMWRKES